MSVTSPRSLAPGLRKEEKLAKALRAQRGLLTPYERTYVSTSGTTHTLSSALPGGVKFDGGSLPQLQGAQ